MSLLLGIDTGGTYTDAVLFDDEKGVVRTAKALTTKHDLALGIAEAARGVLPERPQDVSLVSIFDHPGHQCNRRGPGRASVPVDGGSRARCPASLRSWLRPEG